MNESKKSIRKMTDSGEWYCIVTLRDERHFPSLLVGILRYRIPSLDCFSWVEDQVMALL